MDDELLDDLREAGDFDSEGAFTIDEVAARAKLARFSLPSPETMWLLPFVAAAVQAGASRLTPSAGFYPLLAHRIEWDGAVLDETHVETLRSHGGLVQGWAGALWRAVEMLRALTSEKIVVESGPVRVLVRPEGVSVNLRAPVPCTRVWLPAAFARQYGPADIEQYCCLAPLKLEIMVVGFKGGNMVMRVTTAAVNPMLAGVEVTGGPEGYHAPMPSGLAAMHIEGLRAHLWIPVEAGVARTAAFVSDGIKLAAPDALEAFPDISFLASAPDVRYDLSMTRVVRDERFAARVDELHRAARVLVAQLLEAAPRASDMGRVLQLLGRCGPLLDEPARTVVATVLGGDVRAIERLPAQDLPAEVVAVARIAREQLEQQPTLSSDALSALRRWAEVLAAVDGVAAVERLALFTGVFGDPFEAAELQARVSRMVNSDAARWTSRQREAWMARLGSPRLGEETHAAVANEAPAGETRVAAYIGLAEVQLALGRHEEARGAIEKAMALSPPPPLRAAAFEALAEVWRCAGDIPHAVKALEQAIDLRRDEGMVECWQGIDASLLWSRLSGQGGGWWSRLFHAHENKYESAARHGWVTDDLGKVYKLSRDHPYAALAAAEALKAEVVSRHGRLAPILPVVERALIRLHRDIGKASMADAMEVRLHLLDAWREAVSGA